MLKPDETLKYNIFHKNGYKIFLSNLGATSGLDQLLRPDLTCFHLSVSGCEAAEWP